MRIQLLMILKAKAKQQYYCKLACIMEGRHLYIRVRVSNFFWLKYSLKIFSRLILFKDRELNTIGCEK